MSRYAWAWKYIKKTLEHKAYVLLASRRVGVPLVQALLHDMSKLGSREVFQYGRQFFGDKGDRLGFGRAWVHHQNSNPHHWEYWITRSGHFASVGVANQAMSEPIAMPERYVREMLADWMGASQAYTGSSDIMPWYREHRHRMVLHPETEITLRRVMGEAGLDADDYEHGGIQHSGYNDAIKSVMEDRDE